MSLKDEVRWVQRAELHRHHDPRRRGTAPITKLDLVPAIPVAALRKRLRERLSVSQVGSSVAARIRSEIMDELLAELEGV